MITLENISLNHIIHRKDFGSVLYYRFPHFSVREAQTHCESVKVLFTLREEHPNPHFFFELETFTFKSPSAMETPIRITAVIAASTSRNVPL